MRSPKRSLWSQLVEVGAPFFREGPRRAWLTLAVMFTLLLTVNGLNVVNSYVGRDVMTALEQRHAARFFTLALALVAVFAGWTVIEVFARYVEQRLGLWWRQWLTRRVVDRYLADHAYRRLAERGDIDNPDQRISEDVRTFTATTLSFLILLFNAVLTFTAFAGILWSITPWLFLAAVLYAAAGSFGTILVGRRLIGLNNEQLHTEADFRFALGRVREHAGAVAELGGEREEKVRLDGRLGRVVENFRGIIDVSRNLGFFTTLYNFLPQILPALLVAPLYIRGEVAFGTVTQSAMAFTQLLGAFSLIVVQFQQLSNYAAVVHRLGALWEATEPGAPVAPIPAGPTPKPRPTVEVTPDGRDIAYEGVTLWAAKEDRVLVRDLTLKVPQGKRLVITGPSGAGKTALLLATAGLWERGKGRIVRPDPGGVMFLPQRPYAAPATLRDLLLYGLDHDGATDERLLAVLAEVGLEALARRPEDLDAEHDWPNVLSEGEQEGIALARVLLARPRFAFLDDPTGVLDPERSRRLYSALDRAAITYVSVGHHPELLDYHDLRLELQGDGTWRIESVKKR